MALFKIMNTARRNMFNRFSLKCTRTSIINLLEKEALYRKLSFYIFDLFLNKESSSFSLYAYYAHFSVDYWKVLKYLRISFANKSKKKIIDDYNKIRFYCNYVCEYYMHVWGTMGQFICIYNVHGTDCALESDKHYIINRGT